MMACCCLPVWDLRFCSVGVFGALSRLGWGRVCVGSFGGRFGGSADAGEEAWLDDRPAAPCVRLFGGWEEGGRDGIAGFEQGRGWPVVGGGGFGVAVVGVCVG